MLVNALGLAAQPADRFDDVRTSDDYDQALGVCRALGIVEGNGNNRFTPTAVLSRQEMMAMTERALAAIGRSRADSNDSLSRFKDSDRIGKPFRSSMANLAAAGLVEGSDGRIGPDALAIRAEAAVPLYRAYLLAA
ncbi:S-layer homology domain-containing protein [Cohnella sp. GCM10020058]|uniref:S-layer homology domain-containing protein n=1 Tax=Cohnella sp. GCM10020058 TaxID=3317330 RepID=UPI00363D3580